MAKITNAAMTWNERVLALATELDRRSVRWGWAAAGEEHWDRAYGLYERQAHNEARAAKVRRMLIPATQAETVVPGEL